MKAVTIDRYGDADVLELNDVQKPEPGESEVLVKIKATSINDWDWGFVTGYPWGLRLLFGLTKPKIRILGCDVAGIVESAGNKVTGLKRGDEVYGDICMCGFGAFAEYVCVPEYALFAKPATMTFEQAAAIPQAAMLAYQGLHDVGKIKPGDKILINGAGGGVGTMGLQLAKEIGAEVTGVDSAGKLAFMQELGFDQVLDYREVDFTRNGERYDLVLDAKTSRSPFAYAAALNPGAIYATVGGHLTRLVQTMLLSPVIRLTTRKQFQIVSLKPNKDLPAINKLFEAGRFQPIIDQVYSLNELPKAMHRFGSAEHKGKLVVSIN